MFHHMWAYCASAVGNVLTFLYHFLLSYKSYVLINIVIIGLNLVLLWTVRYYTSKSRSKQEDNLKINLATFGRRSHTRLARSPHSQMSLNRLPSVNVPRQQQSQSAVSRNPRPVATLPRINKNNEKTALTFQKLVSPPTPMLSPNSGKRQTNTDKCDETLDEITWACDESHSPLVKVENVKYCDSQVQTQSEEDIRESPSTHICRRMGKCTDVRDNRQQTGQGDTLVKEENQQRKDRTRQDSKKRQKGEDSQTKMKSCAQKKKTGKLKQRHKKVSRSVNTLKQSASRQQNYKDSEEPDKTVCTDLRPAANKEMSAHCEEKKPSIHDARSKRCRKKQHTSPRAIETVKNSSGDSKNSFEESDLDMGGSDQQYHGNRSESSLVCKRDSWIWFSPDMRPSVEDFAARQRKFRSRDPRVAELAFEISRQEELNRDIERAAESLIDSSSPSTCKLHDCSLRTTGTPIQQKSRIGAIKNRTCRKSRVAPYALPDVKKLPISPAQVTYLAGGDHTKRDDIEYVNRLSLGKELPSDLVTILPVTTSPGHQTVQAKEPMTPTPKRKTSRQKHTYTKSKTRSPVAICSGPRASSASSEHSSHSLAEPIPFEEESLPHGITWYNSPAANVIRRLYTPSRYSPLYDNTTLACSTQCSLCSLASSSLEHAKATSNSEKNRTMRIEVKDESYQRESCLVQNGQLSSPVELKRSPGDINLHLGKYIRGDKMTSPKRRKYHKDVPEGSVMPREEAESCPDSPSNMQERYKDRISPKWRSSKHSPRKRRFSERMPSYSSRLTPETRMESSKHGRRSPQLTFSTGESESDSVYRDKSGGPDASYRQCVISKEVNTTVQRLLFDTEKSSSSHSPSSRSKVQFPDVNTDEDANRVAKHEIKCLPETSNLRQSCTKINISRDSPPNTHAGARRDQQESESDKNSCSSREGQLLQVMNTAPSFISSDSQTYCSCHKQHKFTNIYARDYYLGKRVTMKKQLQASASVHSSKWKKLDLRGCSAAPCHSRFLPYKSRISSSRRDCGSSSREPLKRKSAMKLMTYASRHTHRFRSCAGCHFTQTFSGISADNFSKETLAAGAKDDNEMYINRCKCPNMITSRNQQAPVYNKCNRTKVGFSDIIEKKLTFRKPSSPMDNSTLTENLVSPSKKPYASSRSSVSVHRCKKEDGLQAETPRRLAVASTNNSSSNLSYCSDKSTSSEKPSSFSNSAQFYFVTGTKLSAGNSCHQSHGLPNLKHSKDALVDMFKNSQISGLPMKSGMPLKQNMPVIQSGINNNKVKDSILTECTTDSEIPAYFTAPTADNHKIRAMADRSMGYGHQGKHILAEHEMHHAEKWDTKSIEAASNSMYYSKQNPDASTPLRHASIIERDNPYKGRVSVLEEGRASKSEALRTFETDTVDVDQYNFTTPVMASTVKQGSNPDSGYDESLSEKANGDCSFQLCMAAAVDSSRTGSSPLWFKLHMSNLDQPDTKSLSMSPQSDGSRDADHAHRSHLSNDCDSEQDTLPSLSDDTFKSSGNFDTLIHQSSETSREVQNAISISSMKDVTTQEVDQSLHELTGYNAERVSSHKAAKENKTDYNWAWHHNIENETGNTGSQRKLLPECNKLYLNASSNNSRSGMFGCHAEIISLTPASTGHKHSDLWTGMIASPELVPEGSSYSVDVSNNRSTAVDHFVAQMPTIFHFKAKSSEAHILEKDTAETLTQTNSKPAVSCGLNHAAELQEAKIPHSLYKSACHLNTLESTRATNLTQSSKDIDSVWPTESQNERMPVTYLPMVNSQASKATSLKPRLKTPLATHMALDWPPLDEPKLEETTLDLLGKEPQADQPDNVSIDAGNSKARTTLDSCRLAVSATETQEDALPQSINLPLSSSDEEDATEGECSPGTHVHKSDFETSENSTGDFSARRESKTSFTENGTRGPQWSCQEGNIHTILTSKLHQNTPKQQQPNTRFLNQAKSKVFISDRSIPFSEILKRF